MDLADFTLKEGTFPQSNSITVAATLFVVAEGARTMTNLVGSDRFSSKYGGELMGASYTATVGMLASAVVGNGYPALAALAVIVGFTMLYHWQENKAVINRAI